MFAHYSDVIMGAIASQITSLTIVYSIIYLDADQRKHQSSASLAFVREFTRTGEFPAQMASYAKNVSLWWRHHAEGVPGVVPVMVISTTRTTLSHEGTRRYWLCLVHLQLQSKPRLTPFQEKDRPHDYMDHDAKNYMVSGRSQPEFNLSLKRF